MAKSIGSILDFWLNAVCGREWQLCESIGGGTTPHVFGRYTLSFVQCVGPALCVRTPTPGKRQGKWSKSRFSEEMHKYFKFEGTQRILSIMSFNNSRYSLPVAVGSTFSDNSGYKRPCACIFRNVRSIIESGNGWCSRFSCAILRAAWKLQ